MLSSIYTHYSGFLAEVDREFSRVRDIFIDRMQCRKGCSSCCSQLFSISAIEEPVSEVKRRPKPPSVDSRFRGNNEILSCITHQCIVLKSEIVMTVLA